MIVVDGRRMADTESSSSDEETDREKTKPTRKCYDINIVKPLSEIVRISGRLKIHHFPLSIIKEDQTWENGEDRYQDAILTTRTSRLETASSQEPSS